MFSTGIPHVVLSTLDEPAAKRNKKKRPVGSDVLVSSTGECIVLTWHLIGYFQPGGPITEGDTAGVRLVIAATAWLPFAEWGRVGTFWNLEGWSENPPQSSPSPRHLNGPAMASILGRFLLLMLIALPSSLLLVGNGEILFMVQMTDLSVPAYVAGRQLPVSHHLIYGLKVNFDTFKCALIIYFLMLLLCIASWKKLVFIYCVPSTESSLLQLTDVWKKRRDTF